MLDFQISSLDNEKQSRTTQIRHGEGLFALIERAATSLAVDKSVFLRAAITREAERVLKARSRHVLSSEDAAVFASALDTPPKPTPRAVAAKKSYKTHIVHAD